MSAPAIRQTFTRIEGNTAILTQYAKNGDERITRIAINRLNQPQPQLEPLSSSHSTQHLESAIVDPELQLAAIDAAIAQATVAPNSWFSGFMQWIVDTVKGFTPSQLQGLSLPQLQAMREQIAEKIGLSAKK